MPFVARKNDREDVNLDLATASRSVGYPQGTRSLKVWQGDLLPAEKREGPTRDVPQYPPSSAARSRAKTHKKEGKKTDGEITGRRRHPSDLEENTISVSTGARVRSRAQPGTQPPKEKNKTEQPPLLKIRVCAGDSHTPPRRGALGECKGIPREVKNKN